MNQDIVLNVNNREYTFWKKINIRRSLRNICGSFYFEAMDNISSKFLNLGFKIGHSCTIKYRNTVLLEGYIDEFNVNYTKDTHTIQLGGRDKTCDLVDCSYVPYSVTALNKVSEWKGQPLEAIIRQLCSAFQIEVVVDANTTNEARSDIQSKGNDAKFETFKTEGETVAELITKICLTRAILPVCYGDGKLTLTRAGDKRAKDNLSLGDNILQGSLVQSNKDRYSHYTIKGQGIGIDSLDQVDYLRPKAEWEDAVMSRSRYRPTIILAETITDNAKCFERAAWEYSTRVGESRKVEYTVLDWVQYDAKTIWPLNGLVVINDSLLGIEKEMLITDLLFSFDKDTGKTTKITVEDPNAYKLLETPLSVGFPLDLNINEEN